MSGIGKTFLRLWSNLSLTPVQVALPSHACSFFDSQKLVKRDSAYNPSVRGQYNVMLAQASPQRRKARRSQRSGLQVVSEALETRIKVRLQIFPTGFKTSRLH